MMQVEKNVPLPNDIKGSQRKYPFKDLDVGDSFFVKEGVPNRLSGAASYWTKMTARKYRVRTVDGGVRVWRVS